MAWRRLSWGQRRKRLHLLFKAEAAGPHTIRESHLQLRMGLPDLFHSACI